MMMMLIMLVCPLTSLRYFFRQTRSLPPLSILFSFFGLPFVSLPQVLPPADDEGARHDAEDEWAVKAGMAGGDAAVAAGLQPPPSTSQLVSCC
jgi:hypothetical protein